MGLKNVSKIVIFACGPISPGSEDPLAHRSAFQHALLCTLGDLLINGKRDAQKLCYAQDPAYTNIDRSVLKGAGIIILDDPETFLEVDNVSLVVSCGPDVPVREIISEIARPAVMIWDRVKRDKMEKEQYIS